MKSNYRKLGPYIREVDIRNDECKTDNLLGVSTQKVFIESIANTVGTDFAKYKVVRRNQFTYVPDTSRRGDKIGIAMLDHLDSGLVSQAYTVFEIIDPNLLDPEYLMMWFRRPEFDRYARYMSHGSVRELFDWEDMSDVELPVPSLTLQKEIVREYNVMATRIALNEQLNGQLESLARALYQEWFIDFRFPGHENVTLVDSGSIEFGNIPDGWTLTPLEKLTSKIGSGSTPTGGKTSYKESGIALVRSQNVIDFNFSYENLAFLDNAQAKRLESVSLQKSDVLLNITGISVARCCSVPKSILPARVNQHVAIIRPKTPDASAYILCALCSREHKSRLLGISEGGSTRQALTKTDIENHVIILPPGDVLRRFEQLVRLLIQLKENLTQQIWYLSELQNILLAGLATRELEPVG